MRTFVTVIFMFAFSFNYAAAKDCKEDLGLIARSDFGSTEQVEYAHQQIKNGCTFIEVIYRKKNGQFEEPHALAIDIDESRFIRMKTKPSYLSWIGFRNFKEADILKDDPSDGWDLPGFYVSKSGTSDLKKAQSYVSPKIIESLRKAKLIR